MNTKHFIVRVSRLLVPVVGAVLLAACGCSSEQDTSQGADEAADEVQTSPARLSPAQSSPFTVGPAGIVSSLQAPVVETVSPDELPEPLRDSSPEVRAEAAEELEATGDGLVYLATIMATDPSSEARVAAIYPLKNSEDPRAVDILIVALNDEDLEVVEEAIDALWFLGDERAIPYLLPLQEHPNEEIRETAVYAIEHFE